MFTKKRYFQEFARVRGIYKITNKITGNCYVGKAEDIRNRLVRHRFHIRHGYRDHPVWSKEIQEYGYDSFEYELLEEVKGNDEIELALVERKWFYEFCPQYNKVVPLLPVERDEFGNERIDGMRDAKGRPIRVGVAVVDLDNPRPTFKRGTFGLPKVAEVGRHFVRLDNGKMVYDETTDGYALNLSIRY